VATFRLEVVTAERLVFADDVSGVSLGEWKDN